MKTIARIFSLLTHPCLLPFYGSVIAVECSYIGELMPIFKFFICGGFLFFAGVLPAIFRLLHRFFFHKKKDDGGFHTIKLFFYATMLLFCHLFAARLNLPMWFQNYTIGAFAAAIITSLINYWDWRISIYMTSFGALWALTYFMHTVLLNIPLGVLIVLILTTGATATARMLLDKNNLWQISAGLLCGFLCTLLLPILQLYL